MGPEVGVCHDGAGHDFLLLGDSAVHWQGYYHAWDGGRGSGVRRLSPPPARAIIYSRYLGRYVVRVPTQTSDDSNLGSEDARAGHYSRRYLSLHSRPPVVVLLLASYTQCRSLLAPLWTSPPPSRGCRLTSSRRYLLRVTPSPSDNGRHPNRSSP
jgi:hypothetical protein